MPPIARFRPDMAFLGTLHSLLLTHPKLTVDSTLLLYGWKKNSGVSEVGMDGHGLARTVIPVHFVLRVEPQSSCRSLRLTHLIRACTVLFIPLLLLYVHSCELECLQRLHDCRRKFRVHGEAS
jgi:hypothetical protein